MITCPFCTKTFTNPQNLHLHLPIHTKEKPHKCQMCPAAFGRIDCLKGHVRCVHNGIKQIKKRNSQCLLCSYKCYNKAMLQRHLLKHSTELPFSCDIAGCGFKTKYQSYLPHHVREVHSDERPYECPFQGCNYNVKRRGDLNKHLMKHSNEKPLVCKIVGCNYSCKLKKTLNFHTSRAHSEAKPFKCSTCDFRAKSRSEVLHHQVTHTKIKRFQCQAPNCGFASHWKCDFDRHFDRKHRKKHIRCTDFGCKYRCGSITILQVLQENHYCSVE